MKKAFFCLTAAMALACVATSSQASRDEYYEHGEYGGRGYYGGEYGGYREGKFYGMVEAMPPGGVLGAWRVSGREVIVTERTFIKEEYGRIGIGAQVEVKGGGSPFMAYEVEVKSGGRAMTGPPPGTMMGPPPVPPPAIVGAPPVNPPLPPPAMPSAALIPFSGPVEAMPPNGLFGMWKIGGKEVVVTDSTLIKQQNGRLAPGAQVEVKGGGIPFIAHELEVKIGGR